MCRIVVKEQVDLLCIQETKRDWVDKWVCQALWGDSEVCWAESPTINNAGSVWCLWNESTFFVERKIIGTRFIVLEGAWRCDGERITIANIYTPCVSALKRNLWEEIKRIKEASQVAMWCVVGDFNSIRRPSERVGLNQWEHEGGPMKEFND